MSWTRTAVGTGGGTGQLTAVSLSGTINTGSSDIIFAFVSSYDGSGPTTASDLSDSQTNGYTLLSSQASAADASLYVSILYKISPSNSATLQVTWTPEVTTGHYPSLIVMAFTQGSAPTFNTSVGNGTNSSGSVQAGSIGNANDLVVEAMAFYSTSGNTINSTFSAVTEVTHSAGNHIGLSAAWKEIAAATNPTWTTNSGNAIAAKAAAVSGVGGGGGGRGLFMVPSLSGVGVGGSFFRDPLQAREQMVRKGDLYVPERLAA